MSNTSTTLSRKRVSQVTIQRATESPDAQLSATARHMLDVAEPLFAEKGIEQVSLREIVAASGQRNLSAARYHFGLKALERDHGTETVKRVYAKCRRKAS